MRHEQTLINLTYHLRLTSSMGSPAPIRRYSTENGPGYFVDKKNSAYAYFIEPTPAPLAATLDPKTTNATVLACLITHCGTLWARLGESKTYMCLGRPNELVQLLNDYRCQRVEAPASAIGKCMSETKLH